MVRKARLDKNRTAKPKTRLIATRTRCSSEWTITSGIVVCRCDGFTLRANDERRPKMSDKWVVKFDLAARDDGSCGAHLY